MWNEHGPYTSIVINYMNKYYYVYFTGEYDWLNKEHSLALCLILGIQAGALTGGAHPVRLPLRAFAPFKPDMILQ